MQFDKAGRVGKGGRRSINSINTGTAQFDKHLQSELLMPPVPTAQFVGDKFTYEGDKLTAVSAT